MKKIVIDLDNTITIASSSNNYQEVLPNEQVIDTLRKYRELGFIIIIFTSRNMNTFDNNLGKINAITLPIIINWLKEHNVPFDEVYIGKPWCGHDGFYVDDKAIRPNEFTSLGYDSIKKLLK